MRSFCRSRALFVVFVLLSAAAGLAESQTGIPTIIDGDTIKIDGVSHRLAMIDAPERDQQCRIDGVPWLCGAESAKALRDLIRSRPVRCESSGSDVYGRRVSVCFVGNRELNSEMVATGMALAYRQYGTDYVEFEDHARLNKLGLWAGEFEEPWNYRKTPVQVPDDPACNIKGNINSKGRKLYHLPRDPSYSQTVISQEKGERWFCSIDDALAAGWEPAWK